VRTLVISDLHLALRDHRDRLRHEPELRERLREALAGVGRLVLLGDLLELREAPLRDVLADAVPVLAELAGEREVVIVPGNHDHHLLDPWLARRAAASEPPPRLGLEAPIGWRDDEPLGRIAAVLQARGGSVRAAYPGVWLEPSVYATHGHYLDVTTTVPSIERLSLGLTARLVRRRMGEIASAEDVETILAPAYAWLRAAAERGAPAHDPYVESPSHKVWRRLQADGPGGGWRARVLRAGFPVAIACLNRAGLGPLRAEIDGAALRRGSLLAMGEVLEGLGVSAEYVLFGHTHRAGPLPGDDAAEWVTQASTKLINTGCWVHEPSFASAEPATSPYRAGFAARLESGGVPELVNLLD
jgi:predicted phosphodiesterase